MGDQMLLRLGAITPGELEDAAKEAHMANDKLSRAASAIWRIHENAWMDYAMDGSGDCGPMIEAGHRTMMKEALAEQGFTPESYNEELRGRLAPSYPTMSYHTYHLLSILEVETDAARKYNEFLSNTP